MGWLEMAMSEVELMEWLTRIEAEYREMPGLRLTERQMQRLWNLDARTCADLVAALVARGVLRETPARGFGLVRASIARA
jgi:hypothetical protein